MMPEDPGRGGISSHQPRHGPSSSTGPSHLAAAGAHTPGRQQSLYSTPGSNLVSSSIPPFSMVQTGGRTASQEAEDGQSTNNPFHTSVKRLQQIVDQRSPERRNHTAPARHSARTRVANLTSPRSGGVSKPYSRPGSSLNARQGFRASFLTQPTLNTPKLSLHSESTPRPHTPDRHQEARAQHSSRQSSKEPVNGPQPETGNMSASKSSVQGMTPSSSPPHPAPKPQSQQPALVSVFPPHTASGATNSSPIPSTNPSGDKPNVPSLIQRMIAYTRAVESSRNTKDETLHAPLARHTQGLHPHPPLADLAYTDTLAPSPILSDMPAGGQNSRPVIRMHTDIINAMRMHPGSRPGAIRKQPAWGHDNRPAAFANPNAMPSNTMPSHAMPANTSHQNPMPVSSMHPNLTLSNTMPHSHQNRQKSFMHSHTPSTESVAPRDRSHAPITSFRSPSTPITAPYGTPRERTSESLSGPQPQSGVSQGRKPSADHGVRNGGPGKPPPKAMVQSVEPFPNYESANKVKVSRTVQGYDRRPWTERDWRQFSVAMRESISAHNVKPDELVALFRDLRLSLPPSMQEMPLGEVERRLAVWLQSTKKFRKK